MSQPRSHAAARLRAARAAVLGLSLASSVGCYTTQPLMAAPDVGTPTVIVLNDRGRVALGEALGQNVDRLEGGVVSRGDSSFVVAVRNVRYFNGETNEWKGERVTVPVAGVRSLEARRFSRKRTWTLVGALTAGFIAFIITRSVLGEDPTIVEQNGGGPIQGT